MKIRGSGTKKKRIFLVGCPRSGTTLLQSLLAAHPNLVSFQETHFFEHVVPLERETWRRKLGIASSNAPDALEQLAALGLIEGNQKNGLRRPETLRRYVDRFTRALDLAADEAGATHWLEKTPDHLHFVQEIERSVRRPRFIHIVREGQAVIASYFRVRQKFQEMGGSVSLGDVIDEWRADLHRSLSCVGRPNHTFVRYEKLVADPRRVLFRVCEFLGLPMSTPRVDQMLRDYPSQQDRVVGYARRTPEGYVNSAEPWKDSISQPIKNRNRETFMSVLGPRDRAQVDRAVAREERTVEAFPFL